MTIAIVILGLACVSSGGTWDTGEWSNRGRDEGEPELDQNRVWENLDSSPGDFAFDYLTEDRFTRLVVEIDYIEGFAPDSWALRGLREAISSLCHKAEGVEIVVDDAIPDHGSPEWAYEDVETLELQWRQRYHDAESGVAAMYFLYVDGNHAGDSAGARILAYAYHGSSVVMFAETVQQNSSSSVTLTTLEQAVLPHELGHLLGLVDNGIPMVDAHVDDQHRHHDENPDCLMYWQVSTSDAPTMLSRLSPVFDAACMQDIAAAGGKDWGAFRQTPR